jgi:hypothetical protein
MNFANWVSKTINVEAHLGLIIVFMMEQISFLTNPLHPRRYFLIQALKRIVLIKYIYIRMYNVSPIFPTELHYHPLQKTVGYQLTVYIKSRLHSIHHRANCTFPIAPLEV